METKLIVKIHNLKLEKESINLMGNNLRKEKKEPPKRLTKEIEQVLQEAKVIARWDDKPFYIA